MTVDKIAVVKQIEPLLMPPTKLSQDEILAALRRFNLKAAKIESGSFLKHACSPDNRVELSFRSNEYLSVTKTGPSEESVDSMALTLRLFIQERDGLSLRQVADMYHDLPLTEVEKANAQGGYDSITEYLGRNSRFRPDGKDFTNRDLLDLYMYGHLAHLNNDKRAVFDLYVSGPIGMFINAFFEDVVLEVIHVILWYKQLNEQTLNRLANPTAETVPL